MQIKPFAFDLGKALLIAAGSALCSFIFALFKGLKLSEDLYSISAIDVAMIVFGFLLMITSLIGVVVNNYILLRNGISGGKFWSRGIFEYFFVNEICGLAEWRIARGRYILYGISFACSFAITYFYFVIRAGQV